MDRSVVTKHLKNVLNDDELDENSVCVNFAQTADDGKKYQLKGLLNKKLKLKIKCIEVK